MPKILVLNGPNLNLLGKREPAVYGSADAAPTSRRPAARRRDRTGSTIDFRQSNHEGALIDWLHEAGAAAAGEVAGVVLNAGAYTHTSVALHDAIKAIFPPVIEVHLSNVHAREPFRHHSYLSPACAGIVVGFGVAGYAMAIDGLARAAASAMIDKQVASLADAVADVRDGATVMIGGFGTAGLPNELIDALLEQGAQRPDDRQQQRRQRRHRPGRAAGGAAACARSSAPSRARSTAITSTALYRDGQIELELVPQGNLAERIRAAGAGIGGVLHAHRLRHRRWPKARRRARSTAGCTCSKTPIHADVALIKAERGDRWGNLTYRMTARNFGPIMAMAAKTHHRHRARDRRARRARSRGGRHAGLFVQRVVPIDRVATSAGGFRQQA